MTLTDADVGKLVARNDARSSSHRLESIIDGDAITHCGKRMRWQDKAGHNLVVYATGNSPSCKNCVTTFRRLDR